MSECLLRGIFVLRASEFRTSIDAQADVWVGCSPTNLSALQSARGMHGDLEHSDGCVNWGSGEKLLKVEGED